MHSTKHFGTRARSFDIQTLDSRALLAAITVDASNSSDEIRVYVASNTIIVEIDGFGQSFPDFLYDGIVINALGGADTIIIDSNGENPVTINGGNGVDTIEVGKTDSSLDGIESAVGLGTGSSGDVLIVHSEASGGNATYTVSSSAVTKAGYPAINGLGSVSRIELHAGDGADTFNINSGLNVVIDGRGGFDQINLSATANARIESNQDFSELNANAGGKITAAGTAGIFLSSNLSDFEGDLILDTGFLIESNSQAVGGLNYWRDRLVNATTNTSPQVYSNVAGLSNQNDTIGYGYAQNTALTELGGFELDSGDLVLRYALRGDANLSGSVTFDDLLLVAQNYSTTITGRIWTQGDFNLNGKADFDDLLIVAQTYGQIALQERSAKSRDAVRRDVLA